MRDTLKTLLAIVIWASLGLGPGYAVAKHKDKQINLDMLLLFSGLGPLAGGIVLFIVTKENLNTCVLNCGEDL